MFAKDTERVQKSIEKVSFELNRCKGQKDIAIEVAKKEEFLTQLQTADVLYFQGGVILKILETLNNYPNLAELLKGKTVRDNPQERMFLVNFSTVPMSTICLRVLVFYRSKSFPIIKQSMKGNLKGLELAWKQFCCQNMLLKSIKFR